jgi:hypothetical protein
MEGSICSCVLKDHKMQEESEELYNQTPNLHRLRSCLDRRQVDTPIHPRQPLLHSLLLVLLRRLRQPIGILELIRVFVLPHIDGDLTTLTHDWRCILLDGPFSEDSKDALFLVFLGIECTFFTLGCDTAECFGRFVADHVVFRWVTHRAEESRD